MNGALKIAGGTMLGIGLMGLALYAASQSNNATVKEFARKITAGYGA